MAGPKIQRVKLPQTLKSALEEWQNENNDIRFDTAVRIIINGVRAELNAQSSKLN
jgi:hypothetical protein